MSLASCDNKNNADNDTGSAVHWFRRCLRFHDNPALYETLKHSNVVRCVYILDPESVSSSSAGETNKWRFLLECLRDLHNTLTKHNSRLYVVQGQPTYVLPLLFKRWGVNMMSMEADPTPYGAKRDEAIVNMANDNGVFVLQKSSHTLFPIPRLIDLNAGKRLATLKHFARLYNAAGSPEYPMTSVPIDRLRLRSDISEDIGVFDIPSAEDLGLPKSCCTEREAVWRGGETVALKRLAYHLERRVWVAYFEKPKMEATALMASPNSLGPHLNFGCLSVRLLYWKIEKLYKQLNGADARSPFSLHGQLLVREFYYLSANLNSKFDEVKGNRLCMQIPWKKAEVNILERMIQGKTGFPWIDAIMKQLVSEGWIHGVAKHAIISFITHGQLFYSWEEAAKLLDTYCLEGDICTNNGLAMSLSGSSYAQVLPSDVDAPVLSGRKIDPFADYIRRYIPILRSFPPEYIYEPWRASIDIQQRADCIIGQAYPAPMFDHHHALHTNILILQQGTADWRARCEARKRSGQSLCVSGNTTNKHARAKLKIASS